MMTSKVRDLVATLLVVAIWIPYVGYLVRGEMPLVQDVTGMAGIGLLLGLLAFFLAGEDIPRTLYVPVMALSTVALILGLATLVFAETVAAEVLLAVFMGSILLTWLVAMSHYVAHPGTGTTRALRHG